ncbi:MAG: hypothetical protein ACOX0X_02785 [Candidatus Dojkabacteria bacterium]
MALITKSKQQTSEEVAAISEKIKGSKIKFTDLLIPIIVFIVLIFLSVFVFVPMINSALDYQKGIKESNKRIDQMVELNQKLNTLDDTQLSEDVILAKSIIPKVLKVSDFIFYIDTLAREKSLEIREFSAGDMGGKVAQDVSGAGVSGPISYQGEYTNVVSFLDEIQDISPYIIRLQNVEVAALSTGMWSISLNISGYYMADRTGTLDIYKPFKAYTEYDTVLEVFREKSENL